MDPFTITLLALAAVGTGAQIYGGIQAGQARKRQERVQARKEAVNAARERTKQVRQSLRERAAIQQSAASQGVGDSSSAITGASGALTQSYSNIRYINQQEGLGMLESDARQDQIDAQGISTLGSGVVSLAGVGLQNRDEIGDIFGIKRA